MDYVNCQLCPRRCGVNRAAGETGFCGCGNTALVAKAMLLKEGAQLGRIHRISCGTAADGGILAVPAPQGTAAKENGTAAAISCQGRLLPPVKHGLGYKGSISAAAEAGFSGGPVYSAPPGTKLAVYIIHNVSHPFLV